MEIIRRNVFLSDANPDRGGNEEILLQTKNQGMCVSVFVDPNDAIFNNTPLCEKFDITLEERFKDPSFHVLDS